MSALPLIERILLKEIKAGNVIISRVSEPTEADSSRQITTCHFKDGLDEFEATHNGVLYMFHVEEKHIEGLRYSDKVIMTDERNIQTFVSAYNFDRTITTAAA